MEYVIERAVARFAVSEEGVEPREVWDRLARMFVQRHASWLRSYPEVKPWTDPPVQTGSEYEVEGTGGGHYPLIVTEWNPDTLRLSWHLGPVMNPEPERSRDLVGDLYRFQIVCEGKRVIVEAEYASHFAIERRGRKHETDPVKTLRWLMSGLPVQGKIVFVLPANSK